MGYILVQPEVLLAKGINYFQTIPDGRAIAEMRMLKVLGSMSSVDIISSSTELKKLIEEQKAAGIGQESEVVEEPVIEDSAESTVSEVDTTEDVIEEEEVQTDNMVETNDGNE